MYQTRIASVEGKLCRDEMGRILERIGNMPVRPGDAVWTDGRCVYGNEYFHADAQFLFSSNKTLKGILLNSVGLGSLFIYQRNHIIERLCQPKWDRAFANNDMAYALSYTRVYDLDITRDGQPVYIDTSRACYGRQREVEFWKQYWDDVKEEVLQRKYPSYNNGYSSFAYNLNYGMTKRGYAVWYLESYSKFTSEAHPERNSEATFSDYEERMSLNAPDNVTKYYLKYGAESVTDRPVIFSRNGSEKKISLAPYAELAVEGWQEMAAQHGTSQYIENGLECTSCDVLDARVDDKGNWHLVVVASASGYCFQDYDQECCIIRVYESTVTVDSEPDHYLEYTWDTHEKKTYDRIMTLDPPVMRAKTFVMQATVERTILVKNGEASIVRDKRTLNSTVNGKSYSSIVVNEVTGFDADLNRHRVWEGTGGLVGLGVFWNGDVTEESSSRFEYPKPTSIPLQKSYVTVDSRDYEMPIQDGYVCRNSDYQKVYKGGTLVVDVSFPVGGIVALNAKKREYLLLHKGTRQVMLYRDGKISYPIAKIYGGEAEYTIGTTNTRLRWMERIARLKE